MNTTTLTRLLSSLLLLTLLFTGCSKNKPDDNKPEIPETPTDTIPENRQIETNFLEIVYWGDYYNSSTDSYTLYTGNVEHEGMFIKSTGDFIMLSLMTELTTNPNEIKLTTGTYTLDPECTFAPMTIAGENESGCYSYLPDNNNDGYFEENINYFSAGECTVEQLGEKSYSISAVMTLDNGEVIEFEYSGEVVFSNAIAELYPDQIESDIEFEATFGEIFRMGNGLYKLDLMSGDNPYESAQWANRNRLNIFIITEDNRTKVKAGTYTFETPDTDKTEYARAGEFWIQSGSLNWDGSFYFFMDGATWESTYGFINEGNITISYDENDNINIVLDAKDLNGHSIKTTYTGPSEITEQV